MEEKARAAVWASFAADSLSLGVHWIYNTNVIDKKLGRVESLLKPEIASFHKGKEKGDFTHYGDQMMVLLESAAAQKGFASEDFGRRWQAMFDNYGGYVDKATRATLDNLASGKRPVDAGSSSTDLGGASRIAPLLFFCRKDPDTLVAAAGTQTRMTHNHPEVLAAAEFFARVGWRVLRGDAPVAAIEEVLKDPVQDGAVRSMIQDGLESRDGETRQVISDFGQMCETAAALPATVHLIAKYEKNLKKALVENVMAGGDSSARGMLAGMVLGADLGIEAVPQEWVLGLRRHDRILELLKE